MKVLVIGGGGREHALAWKLSRSEEVEHVYCLPGNGGTALEEDVSNLNLPFELDEAIKFVKENEIGLTVVGPEQPLVQGWADRFRAEKLVIFGPSRGAAALEGSKLFAKEIMREAGVPTAEYLSFISIEALANYLKTAEYPLVIKADGLAAGKGVGVCTTASDAVFFVDRLRSEASLAKAANRVIVEQFLEGPELSVIALCAGEQVRILQPARDYKRLEDDNQGPNTGGMGAFTPVPDVSSSMLEKIRKTIFEPILKVMQERGTPFYGALYAGLILGKSNPYVLEFNVRFGDPETQPLLFHMKSDLFPQLLSVAKGELFPQEVTWRDGVTMAVVLASEGYPGSHKKGIDLPECLNKPTTDNIKVFHAGTTLRGKNHLVTSGGRVLAVTGHAGDIEAVREKTFAAIDGFKFTGAQYRHDIGL